MKAGSRDNLLEKLLIPSGITEMRLFKYLRD